MSDEIQFGELEESIPAQQRRPDQNKLFAVAAVGDPTARDLPIFVDLDVLIDMERHALADTTVELGGVMLGGQFEDAEGNPFVLASESLRAEHYESTKGSFKFTHETWAAITRQRDEFPDDLQMVGWYHTHPDWGVFLSGMDMFICDNFFNRPLDIALVIDPCRDDRGMFQWVVTDDGQQIRQTDGFYLFTSRLREAELIQFCELLQSENMSHDPRYASGGTQSSSPIVHIHDQRSSGNNIAGALAGAMMFQFLFLLVICWKVFVPSEEGKDAATKLSTAVEKLEALEKIESTRRAAAKDLWEVDLKVRAMDNALANAGKIEPGELTRAAATAVSTATLSEQVRTGAAQTISLNKALEKAEADRDEAVATTKRARESRAKTDAEAKVLAANNKELLAEVQKWKSDKASVAFKALMSDYRWLTGMALATLVLICGTIYATLSIRQASEASLDGPDERGSGPASDAPSWDSTEDSR
jgi:proteasome lid subunit RPN8/RPN11